MANRKRWHGPDRASFEAAKEYPSTKTGTPYPNCTDQELYDLRHLHEYSNKHFRRFPYHRVSMRQAVLDLEDHLRYPSNSAQAAMDRVQQAISSTKTGVDLPIKAFHDLDRAFFGGYMKGRVRIRWKGSEEHLYEAMGRDHPDTFAVTMDLRYRRTCPIPIAEIILNARLMFLDATEHSKRREMWGTTLHEMIHGM